MSGILAQRPLPPAWRDPAEIAVTVERIAPVAGLEAVPPVSVACPPVEVVREGEAWAVVLQAEPENFVVVHRCGHERDADMVASAVANIVEAIAARGAPVAVAGPEVDVAAELSATVSATVPGLSATRAERIEAAARALVTEIARWQRGEALGFGIPSSALPVAALRAALCTCNGHGPDLACPDHGAALRAIHGAP